MTTPVDFDYSGPPVSVSNGMALQLVSQFGVQNAWHAFLRMRGMKLSNDEANRAVDSFKYFRNKIGHLRRNAKEMENGGGKEREKEQLLGADFDNFLATPDSLELRQDAEQYEEVGEAEFEQVGAKETPPADEKAATKGDSSSADQSAEAAAAATLLKVIKEQQQQQKNNQQKKGGGDKGEPTEEEAKVKGAAEEKSAGGEGGEQIQQQQKDGRKEEIARRHAETIDDVVSLVMEKIRNNQPFEGELNMAAAAAAASQVHSAAGGVGTAKGPPMTAKGPRGGGQRTGMAGKRGGGVGQQQREEPGMYGGAQAQQQQQHAQMIPPTSGMGAIPPGASIMLVQSPGAGGTQHQMLPAAQYVPATAQSAGGKTTILSNYSEIIHGSSAATTSMGQDSFLAAPHHPVAGTQAAPPAVAAKLSAQKGMPLQHAKQIHPQMIHRQPMVHQTQIAAHHHHHHHQHQQQLQHHPQQLVFSPETRAELVVDGNGIPLDLAIQQGMTVQELIQTLKSQNRQQQPQIILQSHQQQHGITVAQVHHHQQQQETPDSSSQEATQQEAQKLMAAKSTDGIETSIAAPKKGRKRKIAETEGQPETKKQQKGKQKQQTQTEQQQLMGGKAEGEEQGWADTAAAGQQQTPKKTTAKGRGKTSKQQERPMEQQQQTTSAETASKTTKIVEREQQRIEEMESQLKRVQKQLTAEHNKVAGQKKRADKLQGELDKALDSIQLLQIDLACQKTDNNNLIAENIALKAENQQLRSKGSSAAHRTTTSASATTATQPTKIGAGVGRGRKKGSGRSGKASQEEEQQKAPSVVAPHTQTPPPLSTELGRRQSKRICVARSQFMRTFY